MNEMKHTEGRLVVDFERYPTMVYIENEDDKGFAEFICNTGESKANALRIAACWNACVGIPDEVLEAPGYSIKAELDSLNKQIAGRFMYYCRLSSLEEIATALEADIDAGRPLEYNVEHLRDELIRARSALGILPEQKVIAFSCGFCGAPLNANKEQVDAPEGYDPNAYPHDACGKCQAEQDVPRIVTREMAIDAGDPSLEGTQW